MRLTLKFTRFVKYGLAAFIASYVFLILPAKALILFDNPSAVGQGTHWCDPCSSGNTGYRVWDSFTLSERSTLQSLRWIGLRSDPLTLGVELEIAFEPYGPNIFSTQYLDAAIIRGDIGLNSSFRRVELPDLVLDAGTYWLSIHGRSTAEQHTWLGHDSSGDNSLIQFGPDPYNPQFVIPRNQDAVFRLNGLVSPIPELSTWAMMLLGFAGVGFMAYRRRKVALA